MIQVKKFDVYLILNELISIFFTENFQKIFMERENQINWLHDLEADLKCKFLSKKKQIPEGGAVV
jgi:hypothetical protein